MKLSALLARRFLTSCLLVASACAVTEARAETLRWQFKAGETYEQTMVQATKTSVELGGQTLNTVINQTMAATWKVSEVANDGTAKVTQNIKRIRMKMNGAGGLNADIDTDSDEKPQGVAASLAAPLKAMTQSEFVLTMNTRGEILDVEVSEETVKALQSLPGAEQLGGMFTKDGLINMMKQGTPSLPKDPVQSGDSWTNSMEMKLPQLGTMTTTNELTYRGPEAVNGRPLQKIDLNVITSVKASQNPLVKIAIKEQKADGTMFFDNAAGHLAKTVLNQNMVMQLTAAGNSFEQNIQQKIEVTMSRKP